MTGRVRIPGIVLIVFVGLLNFHIPHFLLESRESTGYAGYVLELLLALNVLGALVAAVGIFSRARWGWVLGIVICIISIFLYLAQETIGLPGLPQNWLEPSRIVSLVVEIGFLVLARSQLSSRS